MCVFASLLFLFIQKRPHKLIKRLNMLLKIGYKLVILRVFSFTCMGLFLLIMIMRRKMWSAPWVVSTPALFIYK